MTVICELAKTCPDKYCLEGKPHEARKAYCLEPSKCASQGVRCKCVEYKPKGRERMRVKQ